MNNQEIRQITDSRVLAAMAHPLRRRLMDVLKVEGPGTVSALAGRTGQAVGNVSHHIRVLARALRASSPTVCRSPDPMTSPIPKNRSALAAVRPPPSPYA
ncbi:ArsR/SmtB family transcription factor [Streptomyces jumonjinensis]|uniref:ArsR/SmtB family transcription factor n=1 Tax=Streptomyces jumonjinensis TaxID=1945 RepID=UPI0037A3CB0A